MSGSVGELIHDPFRNAELIDEDPEPVCAFPDLSRKFLVVARVRQDDRTTGGDELIVVDTHHFVGLVSDPHLRDSLTIHCVQPEGATARALLGVSEPYYLRQSPIASTSSAHGQEIDPVSRRCDTRDCMRCSMLSAWAMSNPLTTAIARSYVGRPTHIPSLCCTTSISNGQVSGRV
ncbi:hypothetical protein [Kribbella steppae]|uniref:hypothetical protein n=1 Tax=Kribbella steppae TaxID=2512223 RepID=UPI0010436C10|nr:hypothetical protein [Kribbella steppae]